MLENGQEIIRRLFLILPKLNKEKQAYILGYVEAMAATRDEMEENKTARSTSDTA